ncbi:hypothetical protein N7488_001383 [Penicillium malachiteum]|nr:hypothetical protein N7488_001383 [Penicillium malachiteum]
MSKSTVTLASGKEMPLVGFGLWKVPKKLRLTPSITLVCRTIPIELMGSDLQQAIKSGYRLFDGAYDYQNEKEAGEGIRRAIADGLVTREDIFITTKLWNNYHRRGHAWWMDDAGTVQTDKVPIRETWEAKEEVVDNGIARSIGVSNFQAQSIYDILTYARHPLSSLQIEHHPYLVQPELVKVAQENRIAVTAYSSFGPQSFVELPAQFSAKAKDIQLLFDTKCVQVIAKKHNVRPAQVLLRWATQRNVAVIPKFNNQARLAENLDVLGFDMTSDEIDSISALDKGLRFNDPGYYLPNHPIRIFA